MAKTALELDSPMGFGKHRRDTVRHVIETDLHYLRWALKHIEWLYLSDEAMLELNKALGKTQVRPLVPQVSPIVPQARPIVPPVGYETVTVYFNGEIITRDDMQVTQKVTHLIFWPKWDYDRALDRSWNSYSQVCLLAEGHKHVKLWTQYHHEFEAEQYLIRGVVQQGERATLAEEYVARCLTVDILSREVAEGLVQAFVKSL